MTDLCIGPNTPGRCPDPQCDDRDLQEGESLCLPYVPPPPMTTYYDVAGETVAQVPQGSPPPNLCGQGQDAGEPQCCRTGTPKLSILMEAEKIVNGARRNAYGHPENNFQRIADLWNAYLVNRIDPDAPVSNQDVALMMCLMKIARLLETPTHRDSLVDLAGYAATVEMLWDGA